MSHTKAQRLNISIRTSLNSSQLIDQSKTNGAKLINLPPESPLFGRSDKLVRELFETKEPVYNVCYSCMLKEQLFYLMRIIIKSLFQEDDIISKQSNPTYGPETRILS